MTEPDSHPIPELSIPIRIWIVTPAMVAAGVGLIVGALAPAFSGVFLDGMLGGLVAALGITAGGLAISPWKRRKLNEIAPILLGSQMVTFFAIIGLAAVVWYQLSPHATSFGFALACGFLPGLLVQAKGFAGVVAELAPGALAQGVADSRPEDGSDSSSGV